jgi:hypothetical protein
MMTDWPAADSAMDHSANLDCRRLANDVIHERNLIRKGPSIQEPGESILCERLRHPHFPKHVIGGYT